MPFNAKYAFIVSMDVEADKEDLFNEVYDEEHIPALLKVPGVVAVSRLKTVPATLSMAGQEHAVTGEGLPHYIAVYEVDNFRLLRLIALAKCPANSLNGLQQGGCGTKQNDLSDRLNVNSLGNSVAGNQEMGFTFCERLQIPIIISLEELVEIHITHLVEFFHQFKPKSSIFNKNQSSVQLGVLFQPIFEHRNLLP